MIKTLIFGGFGKSIKKLYFYIFALFMTYYMELAYQNSLGPNPTKNAGFADASLSYDFISMYILYVAILIWAIFNLRELSSQDLPKKVAQAELRLFFAIKNSPVVLGAAPADSESEAGQSSKDIFADAMGSSVKESQITVRPQENGILGSEILVHRTSRTQLPHLKLDEPVPVWKLISKFIGQDLTKVSLPVVLNEPQSALQRTTEFLICGEAKYRLAAETDDSLLRLVYTWAASVGGYYSLNYRKKKPFNPMLGETYELVTEHFRAFAEKVQHNPFQMSAHQLEGKNYKVWFYDKPNVKFAIFGGRGMVDVVPKGLLDIYYKNRDEYISITKPGVLAKNIIFGGLYIELGGTQTVYNHQTGERIVIKYLERTDTQ